MLQLVKSGALIFAKNRLPLIESIFSFEQSMSFFLLRGDLQKKQHCPKGREGGQPHFKELKRNEFLTKVGEGGITKHIVKNISTLFCMIY